MCLTCGCLQPNNRHGDAANITADDLLAATKTDAARGLSMTDAVKNITKTVTKDRAAREDVYAKVQNPAKSSTA